MTTLRLPAAALALVAASGCYTATDCRPTRVVARDADRVDLRATSRSAVLEARLVRDNGASLPARTLSFEVLDDGTSVYRTQATTARSGDARADLKRADPDALLALARADQFRASFAGDDEYCASVSEDVPVGIVRG